MQSRQEGSTQFSACSFVEGRTRSPDQLQFATFSFFLLPYTDVTYTHGSITRNIRPVRSLDIYLGIAMISRVYPYSVKG